ncbi:MAG: HDIG domain-containing protein [Myxococcaceae bacterium]
MSEPPSREGNETPPSPAQDVLANRLQVTSPWADRLVQVAVLALVALGTTFLGAPGVSSQKIPELKADDVGRVFRAPSPSGLKASRDYEVPDDARTAQLKDEARQKVRPVFDYDPQVQQQVLRDIQDSFSEMQEIVATWEADRAAKKTEDPAKAPKAAKNDGGATAAAADPKKPVPAVAPKYDDELLEMLKDARKGFEARVLPLDDDDFNTLSTAHFSRDVEKAVLGLLEAAYHSKLVISREELSRLDAHTISVRMVGGTERDADSDTRPPSVMDVKEAAQQVDAFASVPGNLLPDAPQALKRAVLHLAKRQLRPNLTINTSETEVRRRAAWTNAKPATITIKKGQKVIGDGELITETHLVTIRGMRAQSNELDLLWLQVGGFGLVVVLVSALWLFHLAAFRRFRPTRKDVAFMGAMLLLVLATMHLWVSIADAVHDRYPVVPIEALYYCFPLAAGAMLVRFLLPFEQSLFFALVFSVVAAVMLGNSLAFGVLSLLTSLVASARISRAKDRSGIFRAGVWTGATAFGVVLFLGLADGHFMFWETALAASFALVGSTVAVPMLVISLTPLAETVFGYASDIKLLELANLNHPALKELVLQAPGTYHHSIIMGSLVETAAESIGANPLLARSCAYYHDIGKGKNPIYFGENQKGENRHDQLAPAMSAVIIKRHVTDGLEMARQYKLPKLVADAIPQHHGTRLVGYFFHKAQKELEGKEGAAPIDESVYRYPGPKPQFREAALVMIADAVEAASRSMPEPTAPKLHALVQKLINGIFSEGQLDDCDLTLKDLHLITQSFVHTLQGIYHARPAYPPGAINPKGAPANVLTLAKPETPVAKKAGS